jgi:ferredoxin
MSGPTASKFLDVCVWCGVVVAICMKNTLKDEYRIYAELL